MLGGGIQPCDEVDMVLVNSWEHAEALSKTRKRKIAHNTYLVPGEDYHAVRFHKTEIVKYWPDGRVELDSGGWRTITTKGRMNSLIPLFWRVYQTNTVWYLGGNSREYVFEDGITIHLDGSVTGDADQSVCELQRVHRQILRYVDKYMEALATGKVPKPSGADCWYCYFEPMQKVTDHLLAHLEENYFVPSLLVRAMKEYPVSPAAEWWLQGIWGDEHSRRWVGVGQNQLRSALRRYLYRQFGLGS